MHRTAERHLGLSYVAVGGYPCSGAGSTWTRQVL